ncbi:MAG: putative porin [bacterium]
MRALFISLLAAAILFAGSAMAGDAYDDVATDHWAYGALDYLTARGVLEGYPDGFFKGDRTLTRYEFAQAIARLLDTVGEGDTGNVGIMANSLRMEFSDQLALINARTDELGSTVNDMQAQVTDLEGSVADNTARISSLESMVDGLKPGPAWRGEFRYRWQFDDRADSQRFRQRIMFKLGYNQKINDCVEVGFRLSTNNGTNIFTLPYDLGSKDGRTADIYLDRAYVKYSPGWFGWYSEETTTCKDKCGCCEQCTTSTACKPKLDIYAGIFPHLSYVPTEGYMTDNFYLQGLGLAYHFNDDFQITSVASIFVENGSGDSYFNDDTYYFATELKHDDFLVEGLNAWVGMYSYDNVDQLPEYWFWGNGLLENGGLWDFNGDGQRTSDDRFSSKYCMGKVGLEYTWECVWDRPLNIFGEYLWAIDSDAADNIALVNQQLASPIITEPSDDYGLVIGAMWGTWRKECGDWSLYGHYRQMGVNLMREGGQFPLLNRNTLNLRWDYMWAPNALVGVNYIMDKMHNAFGYGVPDFKADHDYYVVEWSFLF